MKKTPIHMKFKQKSKFAKSLTILSLIFRNILLIMQLIILRQSLWQNIIL